MTRQDKTRHPSFGKLSREEFERLENAPISMTGISEKKNLIEKSKPRPRKKRQKVETVYMYDSDTDGKNGQGK